MKRHTLDPTCPCHDCERDRFGDRAALFVVLGLVAIAALSMMAVRL